MPGRTVAAISQRAKKLKAKEIEESSESSDSEPKVLKKKRKRKVEEDQEDFSKPDEELTFFNPPTPTIPSQLKTTSTSVRSDPPTPVYYPSSQSFPQNPISESTTEIKRAQQVKFLFFFLLNYKNIL